MSKQLDIEEYINTIDSTAETNKLVDYVKRINEHKQAIIVLTNKLNNECNHPEKFQENGEYYFDGSYLDQAYTDTWKICGLCGKKHSEKHKTHSWYG